MFRLIKSIMFSLKYIKIVFTYLNNKQEYSVYKNLMYICISSKKYFENWYYVWLIKIIIISRILFEYCN